MEIDLVLVAVRGSVPIRLYMHVQVAGIRTPCINWCFPRKAIHINRMSCALVLCNNGRLKSAVSRLIEIKAEVQTRVIATRVHQEIQFTAAV